VMEQRSSTQGSTTSFHQVLIIIFGSLFFAGGGEAPLADRVGDAVTDSDRRAKAVAAASAIEAALGKDIDAVIDWHEDFFKAIGAAGVDEAKIRGKIDEIIEDLGQFERQQLSLRSDLRAQLEPSEWSEVFDGGGGD